MPKSYIDTKGSSIPYHPLFATDQGDLVIISSDKKALRVEKTKLRDSSTVFRDMLEIGDSKQSELYVEHSSKSVKEGLTLFSIYNTLKYGSKVLKSWIRSNQIKISNNAFELFVLASKFDEIFIGYYIISEGYKHSYKDCHLYKQFWSRGIWSDKLVNQISIKWFSAYAQSHIQSQQSYDPYDPVYWAEIARHFIKLVM